MWSIAHWILLAAFLAVSSCSLSTKCEASSTEKRNLVYAGCIASTHPIVPGDYIWIRLRSPSLRIPAQWDAIQVGYAEPGKVKSVGAPTLKNDVVRWATRNDYKEFILIERQWTSADDVKFNITTVTYSSSSDHLHQFKHYSRVRTLMYRRRAETQKFYDDIKLLRTTNSEFAMYYNGHWIDTIHLEKSAVGNTDQDYATGGWSRSDSTFSRDPRLYVNKRWNMNTVELFRHLAGKSFSDHYSHSDIVSIQSGSMPCYYSAKMMPGGLLLGSVLRFSGFFHFDGVVIQLLVGKAELNIRMTNPANWMMDVFVTYKNAELFGGAHKMRSIFQEGAEGQDMGYWGTLTLQRNVNGLLLTIGLPFDVDRSDVSGDLKQHTYLIPFNTFEGEISTIRVYPSSGELFSTILMYAEVPNEAL